MKEFYEIEELKVPPQSNDSQQRAFIEAMADAINVTGYFPFIISIDGITQMREIVDALLELKRRWLQHPNDIQVPHAVAVQGDRWYVEVGQIRTSAASPATNRAVIEQELDFLPLDYSRLRNAIEKPVEFTISFNEER